MQRRPHLSTPLRVPHEIGCGRGHVLQQQVDVAAGQQVGVVVQRLGELHHALERHSQQGELKQVEARLRSALQEEDADAPPVLDAKDLARVERFGEVAHRHLLVIETFKELTLGQSLAIRRELFGDKVQATANLFGLKDSGALFYRKTPYGKKRQDSDPVALTQEGVRIAGLWRQLHPAA